MLGGARPRGPEVGGHGGGEATSGAEVKRAECHGRRSWMESRYCRTSRGGRARGGQTVVAVAVGGGVTGTTYENKTKVNGLATPLALPRAERGTTRISR
ncbi:hypothetical protein THAOC_15155, partial [Thalassiosira oceanica]